MGITMDRILNILREELTSQALEKTRLNTKKFFKEKIISYGVNLPSVKKIALTTFKKHNFSKNEIMILCEDLLKTTYFEEAIIACHLVYMLKKSLTA